jgi:hypothetical protein
MTPIELNHIKAETWKALKDYSIDSADSRNVARWEKLAKLYVQLCKQLVKMETTKNTKLDAFLTRQVGQNQER